MGDNGNQLLESIGDSNSSSSFDMERRSFSSNSNQSTLGNYNSDHSTAFSTSSQQLNGTHSLPSVLSSISSAASSGTSTVNFTYSDVNSHRKISNAIPFTPSPDDRSNNASQIGDLYSSSSMSAMQSSASNAHPNNHSNSGLNTSATLASLGDYSMQMNDLMNDDNGDGLDMTFWENFDNFNYEADLVMSNNNSNSQQYPQSQSKSSSKRSNDGSNSERKRKRVNDIKDSSNHSKSSLKDGAKGLVSTTPLPHDASQHLLKPNSKLSQPNKKASGLSALPHSILIDSTPSEVICIDEDEDDATNNNIGKCWPQFGPWNQLTFIGLIQSLTISRAFFASDAAVNRNSDKENGTIYPVTPTKELGNDLTMKHYVSQMSQFHIFTRNCFHFANIC